MAQPQRIHVDETADARQLKERLERVLEPYVFSCLAARRPDGVRVQDIADCFDLTLREASQLVRLAEVMGRVKLRRAVDDAIVFVWLPGTIPPLTCAEKRILRAAQRDLAAGPADLWLTGIAHELGLATPTVSRALDFLVFAELLSRTGTTYSLTDLGQEEPS
ncbi:hypothetical protein [Roseibium sp.]|uniref:hypothetical protein n=1 Tax=Roseibium sp. TaxID=1936156 RepID=UPI003B5292B1